MQQMQKNEGENHAYIQCDCARGTSLKRTEDQSRGGSWSHLQRSDRGARESHPSTFDFGSVFSPGAKVDLFTPYIMDDFRDDGNDLALVARLKKGVTLAQAHI